jgi:hypothetical protein
MAAKIRFANCRFHLPQSTPIRLGLGILLIAGGLVGFLPVVGFWMIPLGLLVLSGGHSSHPPLAPQACGLVAPPQGEGCTRATLTPMRSIHRILERYCARTDELAGAANLKFERLRG